MSQLSMQLYSISLTVSGVWFMVLIVGRRQDANRTIQCKCHIICNLSNLVLDKMSTSTTSLPQRHLWTQLLLFICTGLILGYICSQKIYFFCHPVFCLFSVFSSCLVLSHMNSVYGEKIKDKTNPVKYNSPAVNPSWSLYSSVFVETVLEFVGHFGGCRWGCKYILNVSVKYLQTVSLFSCHISSLSVKYQLVVNGALLNYAMALCPCKDCGLV